MTCTTPTCLSYRKRNSTGPLRKYTDLSARTLACQLVDEHDQSGKETVAGLCQHEPVVPWYEDPSLAKKRRHSHEKPVHQRQENGHVLKPASLTQRTKDSLKHTPVRGHPRRSTNLNGVVEAGRRVQDGEVLLRDGVAQILNTKIPQHGSKRERSEVGDANGDLPDHSVAPAKQKDLASFTQTLYDLIPLRILTWLSSRGNGPTENDSKLAAPTSDQEQPTANIIEDEPTKLLLEHTAPLLQETPEQEEGEFKRPTPESAYTLRTLYSYHLLWAAMEQEGPSYTTAFVPFLKQSFAYCLSDPERLLSSVKNLQDTFWEQDDFFKPSGPRKKKSRDEHGAPPCKTGL